MILKTAKLTKVITNTSQFQMPMLQIIDKAEYDDKKILQTE